MMTTRIRMLSVALILGGMALGCGGTDPDAEKQLRSACESIKVAALEKDYGRMYDLMDSGSRKSVGKQLRDFQAAAPGTPEHAVADTSLQQLGLSVKRIQGLTPRQYVIEMFKGMDRAMPDMRRIQLEETRGREVTGIEIRGDRARVQTSTPSGATEEFRWVRESDGWKCVATSVGEGFE
ncbi:MAG: hypothetical protein ABFS86_03075 [Planctomycetota bacterium]